MSFLQIAAVYLIPFMMANASPSGLSGHNRLSRRQDYVESSGTDVNVTIIVPLNTVISSNKTVASTNIVIPYTSLVSSALSNGGGNGETISGGTFAGRKSGGGTRNEIYGTARYGSGYGTYRMVDGGNVQYTPDLTLNMSGRNFPHGFPPLTFGNYSGGKEYYDARISDYPGITPAPHEPSGSRLNSISKAMLAKRSNQTWFIIADGATLNVLNAVLQLPVAQGGCGTTPFEPQLVGVGLQGIIPGFTDSYTGFYESQALAEPPIDYYKMWPWNVLQYYRGSSIALGNVTYDNLYAHNGNNNTDYWLNTPLNTTGVDMEFLNCLNTTIAAVAPIVNPSLIIHTRLTPGQISGVVVGTVAGLALILTAVWFILRCRRQEKEAAALAAGGIPSQSSSIKKGVGLGEAPDDYELADRHLAPPATADAAITASTHAPHNC